MHESRFGCSSRKRTSQRSLDPPIFFGEYVIRFFSTFLRMPPPRSLADPGMGRLGGRPSTDHKYGLIMT